MSGLDQLQYLSWVVYIVIFVAVAVRAVRRPTPAHVDMTLFFGATTILIVVSAATNKLGLPNPPWLGDLLGGVAVALGYLLLRLVRDFSYVPRLLMRIAETAVVVSVVALAVLPSQASALLFGAYLVLVVAYSAYAFYRYSRRSRGVTRRRIQAAALGSLSLALAFIVATLAATIIVLATALAELQAGIGLASGLCYFVAFAPPTWLRRAWQAPELSDYLGQVTTLPRLGDVRAMVHELERAAADTLGAPAASVALWHPETHRLHIYAKATLQTEDATQSVLEADWELDPATQPVAARAFIEQRASLLVQPRESPGEIDVFRLHHAEAVLSAPITAYGKRLGLLLVYAQRAPIFANSDLEVVQLLADQAAVVIENHALIDEESRVRAREEAARLKEDFLSSAAHDLKTPLTGIVTQAQVLVRRAERNPAAPADRTGLDRLMTQSLRLKDLVLELLDVSRLEQGGLIGERKDTDLVKLVQRSMSREGARWRRVKLQSEERVVAPVDAARFEQVTTNLIENALKYSPNDAPVLVHLAQHDAEARLSVTDQGIGIPIEDQPLIFERFHRARNVDDRRFAGMGLGLYIARGIVSEHGGRIWVESSPGAGSTFSVVLPLVTDSHARTQIA